MQRVACTGVAHAARPLQPLCRTLTRLPQKRKASLTVLGLCSGLVTSCRAPGTNMRTTATAGADLRAARWVPRLSARQLTYHLMHPGRLGLVLLPGYSKRRDGALETENNINCETLLFCFEIS